MKARARGAARARAARAPRALGLGLIPSKEGS